MSRNPKIVGHQFERNALSEAGIQSKTPDFLALFVTEIIGIHWISGPRGVGQPPARHLGI